MVGGGAQQIPEGFQASSYIRRAYKNSECRVAIIASLADSDPLMSVAKLAKDTGSALWTIEMGDEKSEQNALDYIEVGMNNGDWVYLSSVENASEAILRKIGIVLSTMRPDPTHFPKRECFRLWLVYATHISLDDNVNPALPQLLSQHAIVAYNSSSTESPTKWVKRMPQEPSLFEFEMTKHQERREAGRQSDSESDNEDEPGQKIVGKWFARAVEFHNSDTTRSEGQSKDDIFQHIAEDDDVALERLCQSGRVNPNRVKHPQSLMTPFQYAVSNEKLRCAKLLLDYGADPNQVRETDLCPPLFMCIESIDLLNLLLERGAHIDTRYQGYTLVNHPSTAPHIARYITEEQQQQRT